MSGSAPPICGMLETAIYVDDLRRAHAFYGGVLGLQRVREMPRMMAYTVAPAQVLLVFNRSDIARRSGDARGHDPRSLCERPRALRLRHWRGGLFGLEGAS